MGLLGHLITNLSHIDDCVTNFPTAGIEPASFAWLYNVQSRARYQWIMPPQKISSTFALLTLDLLVRLFQFLFCSIFLVRCKILIETRAKSVQ